MMQLIRKFAGFNLNPEQDQYEKDLREKQKRHLEEVNKNDGWGKGRLPWKPCRHDGCSECHGTGIRKDGSTCVHMISCDCPRCRPYTL